MPLDQQNLLPVTNILVSLPLPAKSVVAQTQPPASDVSASPK
jgi:hypothetical protein